MDELLFDVFTACSFSPDEGCLSHSVPHNSILAKCHPRTGTLFTDLKDVPEAAGISQGGLISGRSKDIEPKTLDRNFRDKTSLWMTLTALKGHRARFGT